MKTVYLNATLHCRPHANVLRLPERRSALMDAAALPLYEPEAELSEVTAEVVEEEREHSLETLIAWADAIASLVLALGTVLVLLMIL